MNKEKNKFTMSKAKGLIPELRFPEFVKDGEWNNKELVPRPISSDTFSGDLTS